MSKVTETTDQEINRWFDEHHLVVTWPAWHIFELAGELHLHVLPKVGYSDGRETVKMVLDAELFELLLDPVEHQLSQECKWLCFEFGGQFYRTLVGEPLKFESLKYVGLAAGHAGFPFLGIHGGFELGAGSRDYADWCRKAKFLQVTALGLCERHTLAGALKFQAACQKVGLKSVLGETLTVLDGAATYRVKLYVADQAGWRNLLRLHKLLQVDHAGEHVTVEELHAHAAGLFCVFCADTLLSNVSWTGDWFEGVYFQLDPVTWRAVNRDLQHLACLKQALALNLPLVLICDAYYLDQVDHRVKPFLKFASKGQFEYATEDQYFKSFEEVIDQTLQMFESKGVEFGAQTLQQAAANLQVIVDGCDFKIKTGQIYMPKYVLTDYELEQVSSPEELFWALIDAGLKTIPLRADLDVYLERVQREADVIVRGGFIDYFLIARDIIQWAEENGIMVGTGRGSIGGSIVAYLLGITKVDAIEYDLLFERFLNESRIGKGLPDIDTDFVSARREDVKLYMKQRFGMTNVCSIGAFATLASKSAFRDLLRFAGESPATINYFAAIFGKKSDEEFTPYLKKLAVSPKLRQFADDHPYVINDLELVLNQPKTNTIHASGVLITPTEWEGESMEVFDWMPCRVMDGVLVSEWDGVDLDDCGFLKMDALALDQLDKFVDILNLVKVNHGVDLKLTELPREDKAVFDLFHQGYTQDVFQFTTDGLSNYCREAKPDSIEELGVLTSLHRPGPMDAGAHVDYVKIKFGQKEPEYDWGTEEILQTTFGLMVFQEQIIKIVQVVGGFSLTDGDGVRKAAGKKDKKKMESYRERFIQGAVERQCPEYEAVKIWNKIEAFGEYGFNASHAITYSWMGYQCQWLKLYYPLEFWTVALEKSGEEELPLRINELRQLGAITLHGPDVNNSRDKFYTDFATNAIFWSLAKIKFAGMVALTALFAERDRGGSFYSVEEFVQRLKGKKVNRTATLNLILSGAFDQVYHITRPSERLVPVVEFYKVLGEEVPAQYLADDEFAWYRWGKQLCGYGTFDYRPVVGQLGFDGRNFVTPADAQLSNNLEVDVVVAGLVKAAVRRKTRRGDMLKLDLDCNDEELEVVLWSATFEQLDDKLHALTGKRNAVETVVGRGFALVGRVQYSEYARRNNVYSTDSSRVEVF